MTTSRRDVLLQGCAIGAGFIAANMTGLEAWAQAAPASSAPKLRRSLHGMALNDPILQTWRDGVRLLKAASGNISWANFAAIHGSDAGFNLCPHGNWYFLPWHRAYLLMYERAVRKLTSNDDFAMPYWDWTQDRQMPQAYTQKMIGGQPNPLFEAQRDASPTDALPDSTVGSAVINQILTELPFETFGTSRPQGQDSLDQSWINNEFSGQSGTLEATPHNLVHNFVGGIMANSNSSLDPIFMGHHGNIDRIWWMWAQSGADSSDPLWRNMPFQNNFFNADGSQWSPKVTDLLEPEPLGYTYVQTPVATVSLSQPAALALQADKFTSLYVSPKGGAKPAGIASWSTEVTQPATIAKYLEVPVDVDAAALAPVASRAIAAERLRDAEPARRAAAISDRRALLCLPARLRRREEHQHRISGVPELRLFVGEHAGDRPSLCRLVRFLRQSRWPRARRQATEKAFDRPRPHRGHSTDLRQHGGCARQAAPADPAGRLAGRR